MVSDLHSVIRDICDFFFIGIDPKADEKECRFQISLRKHIDDAAGFIRAPSGVKRDRDLFLFADVNPIDGEFSRRTREHGLFEVNEIQTNGAAREDDQEQ